MRGVLLGLIAIQIGLAGPVCAENPADSALPLFEQNRCGSFRSLPEQLFCGDPELNSVAAALSSATQDRLSRLPNRQLAVAENVQWIRDRNSSCGILGRQTISSGDFASIKACLLKETEERIAILTDPNFDCLGTNTTAGLLICSDPSLASAKMELNERALALIGKLKGDEARQAFAEYGRWSRERDRKCDLVDKENVPLEELSSSAVCLAEHISKKTADIVAANSDPKKVFGNQQQPRRPADAVDLCVEQIHLANGCDDFLSVDRIFEIDSELSGESALITAEVEMVVLSPFSVCSPIASACTGTCWDAKSRKPTTAFSTASREILPVASRVRIEKTFTFQKSEAGNWRCDTPTLKPIDLGVALNVP